MSKQYCPFCLESFKQLCRTTHLIGACRIYSKYLDNPQDDAISQMIKVVGFDRFRETVRMIARKDQLQRQFSEKVNQCLNEQQIAR